MKKNVLIFTILILFISTINSLTIVKKSEKTLLETDFIPVAQVSNYTKMNDAFVIVTIPDAVFVGSGRVKYEREFYYFDRDDNKIYHVDVAKGRTLKSINSPSYSIVKNDTLLIHDSATRRVSALLLSKQGITAFYSYDTQMYLSVPVFNIIDNKFYASKSFLGSQLSKGLSVFDIKQDTSYVDSRNLENESNYIDCYRYRKLIDTDIYEKMKNTPDDDIVFQSFKESMTTENVYFKNYVLKHNNEILIVNSYATDIYRIVDDREELVDSINIGLKYRENELRLIEENKFVPMQFDVYSQTHRVFSDESRDFIMLYIQQMKKLRKASGNDCDYILIKKLGVTEGESEWMIPIDFIPVYYNEEESTFYGFRKVDGFLNYVEYKLEV